MSKKYNFSKDNMNKVSENLNNIAEAIETQREITYELYKVFHKSRGYIGLLQRRCEHNKLEKGLFCDVCSQNRTCYLLRMSDLLNRLPIGYNRETKTLYMYEEN